MMIAKHNIRELGLALSLIGLSISGLAPGELGGGSPEVQVEPRRGGVLEVECALTRGTSVAAAGNGLPLISQIHGLQGPYAPLVTRTERVVAVSGFSRSPQQRWV